jgi:uncharacterized OsmC-like protein
MKAFFEFAGERKFKATVRDHEIWTDVPKEKGGDNAGPTPSELFIASIGCCTALFVARYLRTAQLNSEGLSVEVDWEFSEDKSSIGKIDFSIRVPNAELGARKKAVLAAAEKCTLHKTLHKCPEINVSVKDN